MMVYVNGKWINLNDANDIKNLHLDLHKVAKVVEEQVANIAKVESNANSAVSQANLAMSQADVNKASISAASSAIESARSDATAAITQAQSASAKNVAETAKRINDDINSAVNAVSVKVDKNSAGIVSNASAIALQSRSTSDAVAELKTADGKITQIAKDAESNAIVATQSASAATVMAKNNASDVATVKMQADKLSTQVGSIAKSAQANATAIDQTKSEVSIKADQATVNDVKKTVDSNHAQLQLLAGEVKSKVSNTDVTNLLNSKGYVTQKTVEDTFNQKAGSMTNTIAELSSKVDKDGKQVASATEKVSALAQTVNGFQTTIKNKADTSTIQQLSNQLIGKVDTKDFTSEIALLNKNINLRVTKGDVISQLNLEAGGDGLIQVANGKGKLYLDADSVVFSGKAFIPSAAIVSISADQIKAGTLDAALMRVINLTADHIHGGTLDVGDMNIKNLTADDIKTGTLIGVDIMSEGDKGKKYEMTGSLLKWSDGEKHASIGQNEFHSNYIVDPAEFSMLTDGGIYIGRVPFDKEGNPHTSFEGWENTGLLINGKGIQLAREAFNVLSIGDDNTYYDPVKGKEWKTAALEFDTIHGVQINLNPSALVMDAGTREQKLSWEESKCHFYIQKDNHIGVYIGQGKNGNQINMAAAGNGSGINFNGNFHVTGSKNSVVETKQGWLAINAYETAEYYFGDLGENNTGSACQTVIGIDRIFNETVNTDIPYQVFVTPYSDAHVWVKERYNNRFVVCSDKPNAEFGWELKAKRKGYESNRLRRVDADFHGMKP